MSDSELAEVGGQLERTAGLRLDGLPLHAGERVEGRRRGNCVQGGVALADTG